MNNTTDHDYSQHTLKLFEGELNQLHLLLLEMTKLVALQLNLTMQALDEGDMELANLVIQRNKTVNRLETQIDAEVMIVLARQCPVANDLRTVISTSKIALELEKIGAEIVEFAKLVMVLFDPKSSDPNPKLLTDIVKIGQLVRLMLEKLALLIETNDSKLSHQLFESDRECEAELQEGIKRQLSLVVQDGRMIGRALDIMQIMKSLEYCGEHCRNIAEYMIYMTEGKYIRQES
jgi:phosphate transport system protein